MRRGILLVGVQNDFCPGGARPASRGGEVIGPLSCLANTVDQSGGLIVVVREWQSPSSPWFDAAHPAFCVAGTRGASFHEDLHLSHRARQVFRSADPDEIGPSAFRATDRSGRSLAQLLRDTAIEYVFIAGSAMEREVRHTALDARRQGLRVAVVQDAVASLDERDGEDVLGELLLAGIEVVSSGQAIMDIYSSGEVRL